MISTMYFLCRFRLLWLAICLLGNAYAAPAFSQEDVEKNAENKISAQSKARPSQEDSSGAFLAGQFAHGEGNHGNAVDYLEQAHRKNPDDADISGQLVVAYINSGRMNDAVTLAQGLAGNDTRPMLMDLLLAVDNAKNQHYSEASTTLSHVYTSTPGAIWLPLMKAWLKLGQGALTSPVTAEDLLPQGEKAPAFLTYHLALLNDQAGFTEAAAGFYQKIQEDAKKAPFRAVQAAADFYRRKGDETRLNALRDVYLKAHPAISAAVDDDDNDSSAFLTMLNERPAVDGRQPALVDSPQEGLAEVLFTMASVLYSIEASADAQLYLRMALHLRPDFPLAQLMLGSGLENEGRYDEAAEVYGAINPQSPFYERGLLRKAYSVDRGGKPQEALALLDIRAAAVPQDSEVHIAKGDLLRMRGRFAEAAEAYTQAINRIRTPKPEQWGVFFARGACYERLGDWKRGEADLRKSIALSNDHAEALNYLGYSLLIRNQHLDEAKNLIQRAYDLQPDSAEISDSLGWVLYKTGDAVGAIKYLEQAAEAMPNDAAINDHLGDAYWQAGRKNEARFQWERALAAEPQQELEKALRKKLRDGLK